MVWVNLAAPEPHASIACAATILAAPTQASRMYRAGARAPAAGIARAAVAPEAARRAPGRRDDWIGNLRNRRIRSVIRNRLRHDRGDAGSEWAAPRGVVRFAASPPTAVYAAHRFVVISLDTRIHSRTADWLSVSFLPSLKERTWRKDDHRVSRDAAHLLHLGSKGSRASHGKWNKAAAAPAHASRARCIRRDKVAPARPA